jgi:hypothetical protein
MRHKIIFIYLLTSIALHAALCQGYKFTFHLDDNLKICKKSVSTVIGKGYRYNNHIKLDCFSRQTGELLLRTSFKDSTLTVEDGFFQSYYPDGTIKSTGSYEDNVQNWVWQFWDEQGLKTDSIIFDKGILTGHASFTYSDEQQLKIYSFTDSIEDTFTSTVFNTNGSIESHAEFKGQKGIIKNYDSSIVTTDSVYTREVIEAGYPYGEEAWFEFLRKNINSNVPKANQAPVGKYNVIVLFRINKKGTIDTIIPLTKIGFGAEEEVIRVLKKSPVWTPAKQYGRDANQFQKQMITFIVRPGDAPFP